MNLKETLEYMNEAENKADPKKIEEYKKNLNQFVKTFDERINNVKKYFQAFETLTPYLEKNTENAALVNMLNSLKESMKNIVTAYGNENKGFKSNALKFLNSLTNPNGEEAKKIQQNQNRNVGNALNKYKNNNQQNSENNNSESTNQSENQKPTA